MLIMVNHHWGYIFNNDDDDENSIEIEGIDEDVHWPSIDDSVVGTTWLCCMDDV